MYIQYIYIYIYIYTRILRLETWYSMISNPHGFDGLALQWFRYLTGRTQAVRRGSQQSATTVGPSPHLFAHDTQVDGRCSPDGMSDLAARVSACTDDVSRCMRSSRFQLNTDKTEIIWCATSRQLHRLQSTSIRLNPRPSTTVRDIGVYIDTDL